MQEIERQIFRAGSTTYYWSSRFFPKHVRSDIFKLYSFVRVVDDSVDQMPPLADKFYGVRKAWEAAAAGPTFDTAPLSSDTVDERVVKNMIGLARAHHFEQAWITAFLDAMQSDLVGKTYQTLEDSLRYVYGSGEVVGLMLARIFGLPPEATEAARLQGRAMQWLNFVRDIGEDNTLGRCYFPRADLGRFHLADLTSATAKKQPDDLAAFIRFELERYRAWQAKAAVGYRFIPPRLRVAVRTASDMYNWTADRIAADPQGVLEMQFRPAKSRILRTGLKNLIKQR